MAVAPCGDSELNHYELTNSQNALHYVAEAAYTRGPKEAYFKPHIPFPNLYQSGVNMPNTKSISPVEINEENFPTYFDFMGECEKRLLSAALEALNGNVSAMSKLLGVSRMTTYRLLKKHGFEVTPLSKRFRMIGKMTVEYALKAHSYNIENAARDLGIKRNEMCALINIHKIEIPNDSLGNQLALFP